MIRAVLIAMTLVTAMATMSAAEQDYNDFIGVVISPAIPPVDMFEMFTGHVERGIVDDVDGMQREACVVHLEPRAISPGEPLPLDENGRPMILLDDGMTFVTVDELISMIDARYCIIDDSQIGEIA